MLTQQVLVILASIQGYLGVNQVACPQGWILNNNKCYKDFSNASQKYYKSFNAALKVCEKMKGGSLVEFSNRQAESDIMTKLDPIHRVNYWIGLRYQGIKWAWVSGKNLSSDIFFDNIADVKQVDYGKCGVILKHSNNNTVKNSTECSTPHRYICQADSFECSTPDWNVTSSGHCIKVESSVANWTTAFKTCSNASAELARNEIYNELIYSKSDGNERCCALTNYTHEGKNCNHAYKFICVKKFPGKTDISKQETSSYSSLDDSTDPFLNGSTPQPSDEKLRLGENDHLGIVSEKNATERSESSTKDRSTESGEDPPCIPTSTLDTSCKSPSASDSTSNESSEENENSSSSNSSDKFSAETTSILTTLRSTGYGEDFSASSDKFSTERNVTYMTSSSSGSDVIPSSPSPINTFTRVIDSCLNLLNNNEQRSCIKNQIPTGSDIICDGSLQQSNPFSKILPADAYHLLLNTLDVGLTSGPNGKTNSSCLGTSLLTIDDIAKSIAERMALNTSNHLDFHTKNIDSRIEKLTQKSLSTYKYIHKDSNISDLRIQTKNRDMEDIKLSITLISTHSSGERVSFKTNQAKEIDGMNTFLVSRVLSIKAFGETEIYSLALKYTLRHSVDSQMHTATDPSNRSPSMICAFIDQSTRQWSDGGCVVLETDNEKTTCYCNHTTNFAILMQWTELDIESKDERALNIITYIGCSVSLTTVVITLTVFICVGSINSERVYIHRNLCVAIIIAQIAFLAGIKAVSNKVLCSIVALILHYFYLSVFVWMLVEGMHLYSKIVQVFGTEKSRVIYYSGFGWGLPLILVIISASADWDGYGTETSCWLSISNGTIWAFVGPAIGVIVVNMVILCVVIKILINAAKIERNHEYDHIRAGIRGTIFLLPLLGLTWVFGLLAVNENVIVFQYLFAIFNSLQGFFIFLFHCIFNTEVRQAFVRMKKRRSLRKGDFVSLSNSISSRPSDREKTTPSCHNSQNIPPLWSVNDLSVNSSTKSTDVKIEDDITIDDVTEC